MADSRAYGETDVSSSRRVDPVNSRLHEQKATGKSIASVTYQNLTVYGFDDPSDCQKTFFNYPLIILTQFRGKLFSQWQKSRKYILQDFEGIVPSGQMLLVLGKPGSGCTTLLKVLSGDTYGLHLEPTSLLNYQGMNNKIQLLN